MAANTFTSTLIANMQDNASRGWLGLARNINGANNSIMKSTDRMTRRMAVGVPGAGVTGLLGGYVVGGELLEQSKAVNRLAAAAADLTTNDLARFEKKAADVAARTKFHFSDTIGGLNQMVRAGVNVEGALGGLESMVKLSQITGAELPLVSDLLTNVASGLQMNISSAEKSGKVFRHLGDLMTFGATESPATIMDFAQSFKYAGPLLQATGIEADKAQMAFTLMAKAGIRNSEAGVAMRSMLVRLLKPTKGFNAEMEKLGMNLGDYVTGGEKLNFAGLKSVFDTNFSGLFEGGLSKSLKGKVNKILSDPDIARGEKAQMLGSLIAKGMGAGFKDSKEFTTVIDDFLSRNGKQVDLFKFIREFREKGGGIDNLSRMIDARQLGRLQILFSQYEDMEKMLQKFGTLREQLGLGGIMDKQSEASFQGFEKTIGLLNSSFKQLINTFSKSAAFGLINSGIQALTSGLSYLANLDPDLAGWIMLGTTIGLAAGPIFLLARAARALFPALSAVASPAKTVGSGLRSIAEHGGKARGVFGRLASYTGRFGWVGALALALSSVVDSFANLGGVDAHPLHKKMNPLRDSIIELNNETTELTGNIMKLMDSMSARSEGFQTDTFNWIKDVTGDLKDLSTEYVKFINFPPLTEWFNADRSPEAVMARVTDAIAEDMERINNLFERTAKNLDRLRHDKMADNDRAAGWITPPDSADKVADDDRQVGWGGQHRNGQWYPMPAFSAPAPGTIPAPGPTTAELEGSADVNVNLKLDPALLAAAISSKSSGHIRTNVGVNSSHAKGGRRAPVPGATGF